MEIFKKYLQRKIDPRKSFLLLRMVKHLVDRGERREKGCDCFSSLSVNIFKDLQGISFHMLKGKPRCGPNCACCPWHWVPQCLCLWHCCYHWALSIPGLHGCFLRSGKSFVSTGVGSLWTFFLTSDVNLWLSNQWNFHDILFYLSSSFPCLSFALEASHLCSYCGNS